MLDSIIKSESFRIKEIFNSNNIDDRYKQEKGIQVTTDTLDDSLRDEMVKGNLHKILDLYNGRAPSGTSNPLVNKFSTMLSTNLAAKLKIAPDLAMQLGENITSLVMKKFSSEETGRANSETDLIQMLHGDKDSTMSGMLENVASKEGKNITKGIGNIYKEGK